MFAHVKTGLLVALACTTALAAPTPQDEVAGRGDASVCCSHLAASYPLQTFEINSQNYTIYNQFWSSAAVLKPSCVFAPAYPEEVSKAVKIFVKEKCKFAAKGGGHNAVPGAANVDKGVLISFDNMKAASISRMDGVEVVSVQPGKVWGDLYQFVDSKNKVFTGGRFYPVGTGLLLGAGFSFLANEVGFSTDGVHSFEMVLADGRLVTASQRSNPDLFKAQKGGGNNFGIVTRYNLRLYEGGNIIGGMVVTAESETEKWLDATTDYNSRQAVRDVKTHALPAVGWTQEGDSAITQTPVFYNKHEGSTLPPIMAVWNNLTTIANTVRQARYHELAREYAAGFGNGDFQEQRVFTMKVSRQEYAYAWYTFLKWARSQKNIPGFNILHCNMPVTPQMANAGLRYGGNSLGLDGLNEVLTVMYFGITMDQRDDAVVGSFRAMFSGLESHAKASRVWHPWLFWNYAGVGQDAIGSYGAASNAFMRVVRRKYDPSLVFKNLVGGGMKLS